MRFNLRQEPPAGSCIYGTETPEEVANSKAPSYLDRADFRVTMPKQPNAVAGPSNSKGRINKTIEKTADLLEKDENRQGKGKGKERQVLGDLSRLIGGELQSCSHCNGLTVRNKEPAACHSGREICQSRSRCHFRWKLIKRHAHWKSSPFRMPSSMLREAYNAWIRVS
jgi:hypothetical protein